MKRFRFMLIPFFLFSCGNPDLAEEERQELQNLRSDLRELELQKKRLQQHVTTVVPSRISQTTNQINYLQSQLEHTRLAEFDIDESTVLALEQQTNVAQMQQQQIEGQIRTLESEMQRLNQQITYRQFNVQLVPTVQAEIGDLRRQMNEMNQQVQALRTQQAELTSSYASQSQNLMGQAQIQKSDLLTDQISLQDQIDNLNQNLVQLKNERTQSPTATTSLDEEIQERRREIANQEEVVRNLERSNNPPRP